MRLHAFILAVSVCVQHVRAASITLVQNKFDLDNVDLDDEQVSIDSLRKTNEVIPVVVVEEPVVDENSNDYIPPLDTNISVKRIELDLEDPGLPQRQEHETQNPENFSDNDKTIVAIRNTVEQAEKAFNDGLRGVSDSFKTFLQANEDIPAIQQNIQNLKEKFTDQIEKLNQTIRNYIKPETASSGENIVNPKLEMVQARLKFLDNNFKLGVDTLTEGVEVYTIIKEEDEAEKAIALKADVKAEPEVSPVVPQKPVENPAPANNQPPAAAPVFPWTQYLTNWQNSMSAAFTNINNAIVNTFTGNNQQNPDQTQQSNPVINFFQGIPNIFQGQNTVGQSPAQSQPSNPPNVQHDSVQGVTPAPPVPWSPQGIYNSVTSAWNNLVNPGQNNQQQQPPNILQNNPIQQAFQNMISIITPQSPQAQQPVNHSPPVVATPEKVPINSPPKVDADLPVEGSNAVPAPVNDQPQAQVLPNPTPAAATVGPIQQMVQNNPIIKGIQSAVQRIQGTPNPETPREEVTQESEKKEDNADPKGHYHGGDRPNQGDTSNDSGTVEYKTLEKAEEKETAPSEEKDVLEEQITPEELKTPAADKTE